MPVSKLSAGLLMYRHTSAGLEVFLAHPGGPFFRKKDDAAWSVPKGAPAPGEPLEAAAIREFGEEIGLPVTPPLLPLGQIEQRGGKVVHAWAFAGDAPAGFHPRSNTFDLEWPPRSGRTQSFPEVDRAGFFPLPEARRLLIPAQVAFVDRLVALVGGA
jgi:predicted NUDIX family NTP pyrophosphohydrolase